MADLKMNGQRFTLLAPLTIGAPVSGVTPPITDLSGMRYLVVMANFLYGAAGTTVKAWVQTSLDGGLTWIDVMSFAFLLAAANKVSAVGVYTALAAVAVPGDGVLADNTIVNGLLGDQIRVKYITTGTYTGATSLALYATAKG
jgi:hypothetical protein